MCLPSITVSWKESPVVGFFIVSFTECEECVHLYFFPAHTLNQTFPGLKFCLFFTSSRNTHFSDINTSIHSSLVLSKIHSIWGQTRSAIVCMLVTLGTVLVGPGQPGKDWEVISVLCLMLLVESSYWFFNTLGCGTIWWLHCRKVLGSFGS